MKNKAATGGHHGSMKVIFERLLEGLKCFWERCMTAYQRCGSCLTMLLLAGKCIEEKFKSLGPSQLCFRWRTSFAEGPKNQYVPNSERAANA